MAVFIELVTDAFEAVFRDQVSGRQGADGNRSSRAGRPLARRPVRGIEIKTDTYAYLKIVLPNGRALPLLDSSSPTGENDSGYTNFMLQSVAEERMEKHQIVETFGDAYIFFFGESPRFLNISATLVNTHDFNWLAEWWHNYENYLRGTKLVEMGARCYLFYDDNVVEGYILGAQAQVIAETPYQVSLNFRFFVTKYRNISLQNVQYYPIRAGANIIEDPELTNADAFTQAAVAYRGDVLGEHSQDALSRNQAVLNNQLTELKKLQQVEQNLQRAIQEHPNTQSLPIDLASVQLAIQYLQGTIQSTQTISDKIRNDPFLSMDPEIWTKLVGVVGVVDPNNPNNPLSIQPRSPSARGLIAENVDEYMMGSDEQTSYANELQRLEKGKTARQQAADAIFEANDLTRKIVENLTLIGCRADNVDTVRGLGLGPNFGPGFGCGAGGSSYTGSAGGGANFTSSGGASPTASFGVFADFSASAGVSASATAGFGASASARAGSYANVSVGSASLSTYGPASSSYASSYASFQSDPLSAVYGRAGVSAQFGSSKGQLFEGQGDAEYGYPSEFGGAGYGQAGYGDFGGKGFGGASSQGDPGYIASASFSFKGVAGAEAAYSKFTQPRQDNTALTGGCQLGGSSLNGRGSVNVGGSSSAFALVSAEGSIEPWASAQASASATGSLHFGASASASAYATAGIGL